MFLGLHTIGIWDSVTELTRRLARPPMPVATAFSTMGLDRDGRRFK